MFWAKSPLKPYQKIQKYELMSEVMLFMKGMKKYRFKEAHYMKNIIYNAYTESPEPK